jgi:hypothetical protein
MKRLLMPLFTVLLVAFSACEDIQDNTPAMQGTLDDVFFKANDARASETLDGDFLIQGITQDETLTLKVPSPQEGIYTLGEGSANYASFEDIEGNLFTTDPNGSGKVEITRWDTTEKVVDGTFNFTAIIPGVDTLVVQRGIFYRVPYGFGEEVEEPGNAGNFAAEVDGATFNPFTVTAVDSGNSIIIAGASTAITITIRVPVDVETGSYSLPEMGFGATYSEGADSEQATSGTIIIVEHDVANRIIKGTFSFQTANHSIGLGQFNVTYQ